MPTGSLESCYSCGKPLFEKGLFGAARAFIFKDNFCNCNWKPPEEVKANTSSRTSAFQRRETNKQNSKKSKLYELTESLKLSPGALIGGNYRIIAKIGEGGMGIVYRVAHISMESEYALKLLPPDQVNEESFQRFRSEARNLGALNHPTFVKVYDFGLDHGRVPFYTMDLVSGKTLEQVIIENGPLSQEEATRIFLEVLDGLAYAHRNGIIHRDLKPSNIMLCKTTGTRTALKILDFGLSKATNSAGGHQNLTSEGEVFGSPCYMSPEQCLGSPVDARSDIYSVGCSLFETLTGLVPFEGASSVETILLHQTSAVAALSDVAPDLEFSDSIEFVVAKCLAKNPRDRYQSAKELAIDLQRMLDGKELSLYRTDNLPPKRTAPVENSGGDDRLIFIIPTVLILILAAAGSIFICLQYSEKKPVKASPDSLDMTVGPQSDLANMIEIQQQNITDRPAADLSDERRMSHCYLADIKASEPGCGTFMFPKKLSLGQVFFDRSGIGTKLRSVNLQGHCELPLDCNLVLVPGAHLFEHPHWLNYLKPLRIVGVALFSQAQASGLIIGTDVDVHAFYQKAAELPSIHWIELVSTYGDSAELLQLFKNMDSLSVGKDCPTLGPQIIAYLVPHLKTAVIRDPVMQMPFLEALSAADSLDELRISGKVADQQTLDQIFKFKHLRSLAVSFPNLSNKTILRLFKTQPLKVLCLNYESPWTDELVAAMIACKTLREVQICGTSYLPTVIRTKLNRLKHIKFVLMKVKTSGNAVEETESLERRQNKSY